MRLIEQLKTTALEKIYSIAANMLENPVVNFEADSEDAKAYHKYIGNIFKIAGQALVADNKKSEELKTKGGK